MHEKPETMIGLRTFRHFLNEIATWARNEKIVMNGLMVSSRSLWRVFADACSFDSAWIVRLRNISY